MRIKKINLHAKHRYTVGIQVVVVTMTASLGFPHTDISVDAQKWISHYLSKRILKAR